MRRRLFCRATVLAVTGSCGKTTATRFLGAILSDRHPSLIGVADNCREAVLHTLRHVKRSHRFVLHEIGVSEPGSMAGVLPLLRPHIGVVTTIGQDHYRNFRTLEATAAEKGLLIESLPPSGVAVLNADDPQVLAMARRTKARVLTYGRSAEADVRATDIRSSWPERLSLTVTYQGESVRIETGLFGDLLATSVLAAIAGALAAGIRLHHCAESLRSIESYPRRLSIHPTSRGAWFICDTYKAAFWGVRSVLALLVQAQAPRKTVVFGSFSDTSGADSGKYRSIAREALQIADRVLFIGVKAIHIRKMLSPATQGRLFMVESAQEAARLLSEDVMKDELVLIKSSNLEHAERLMFSQDVELRCWIPRCSFRHVCDRCPKSGLLQGS